MQRGLDGWDFLPEPAPDLDVSLTTGARRELPGLLALDGPDGLRLPAWQFDPDARRGRLEGIARVAATFPGRVLSLSSWVVAPNAGLGGRSPRQALLDGDVEQVVAVAAHHGA